MSDAPPRPPDAPSPPERVAQIGGDRLCARCGYTLRGQTVEREPHYGLLIARCPECGTPAALQEYPALAASAGRLRVLGLLVFLAAILALLGVHIGVQAGSVAAFRARAGFTEEINAAWRSHVGAVRAAGGDAYANAPQWVEQWLDANRLPQPGNWVYIDAAWWDNADQRAILGSDSLVLAIASAVPLSVWVIFSVLAALLGAAWSIMLLQRSRPQVLLMMAVPMGLTALITVVSSSSIGGPWTTTGWVPANELVREGLVPTRSLVLGTAHGLACCWIGVWFGRSAARGLARALVPPELRGPLAILWFRDGLTPPRGAPGPSRLHPEARRGQGAAHDHDRPQPV
jgi:hypothetical protein